MFRALRVLVIAAIIAASLAFGGSSASAKTHADRVAPTPPVSGAPGPRPTPPAPASASGITWE
jgi:hypothetical protein